MSVSSDRHAGSHAAWPLLVGGAVLFALAALVVLNWSQIVGYVQLTQAGLHRDLAAAVQAVKAREGTAFWSLIGLSFLYGIVHAAGPGHGKVIIATYLSSHPERLARGIVISVLAALTQGLTAVFIVTAGFWLFSVSARETKAFAGHLETMSYALVMLLGCYLIGITARRMARRWRSGPHHVHKDCGHHHHHSVADTEDDRSAGLLGTITMIASIGLRPCSGAILVLVFAAALDVLASGSIAVMAMSAGTAITVSSLAALTHTARRYAVWLAARMPGEGGAWRWSADLVALAGGLVILLLGLSLLQAGLATPAHPLL